MNERSDRSPTSSFETLQAQIGGMDCGSCARTIEASLQQMPGVESASVSFATGRLNVSYAPQRVQETAIRDRIAALGYTVDVAPSVTASDTNGAPDSDSQNQAQSVIKKTQNLDLTGWQFWLGNRRGQAVILSGLGLRAVPLEPRNN